MWYTARAHQETRVTTPNDAPRGRGRPRLAPPGTARRSVLCTDAEYAALMAYLWGTLRGVQDRPPCQEMPTKQGDSTKPKKSRN